MYRKLSIITIFTLIFATISLDTRAEALKFRITDSGGFEALPIAIADFGTMGSEIRDAIEGDLEGSGLFNSIDRKAFIQDDASVFARPRFGDWRKINAQALLVGNVVNTGKGFYKAEFRLWDIFSGNQFAGMAFTSKSKRRLAHRIADEVYSRLTGEGHYFDSRIVYVSETIPVGQSWKNRVKRLAIMDQDGANHRYLTTGKSLVLTPRFDRNSQTIIYLGYYGKIPSVYLYNIKTGKEEILGNFPGMSFAPRFSPDGKKVIMSVSLNGNSEIFTMDIDSRKRTRITNNRAIDTSPSFSPDGKKIVFNSDRGGRPQLYVMNSDGSDVKRISFGKGGSYATPVWSPRGDYIVFTRLYKSEFYIGVMKPDGSGERLITKSFLVEGPTWSPNGRVIMFAKQSPSTNTRPGKASLHSIDITGNNEQKIDIPLEGSDPAWSPLLIK